MSRRCLGSQPSTIGKQVSEPKPHVGAMPKKSGDARRTPHAPLPRPTTLLSALFTAYCLPPTPLRHIQETNPVKICHLGKYYPPAPGGIETHVRTLAHAQAEQGAKVRVVCVRHDAGPTMVEDDGPVRVVRQRRAASVAKLDVCPGMVEEIQRSARGADILHIQTPNPLMILALWLARPKTPWVITHQSDVLKQKARAVILGPFERWAYRRAAAILPTSPTYVGGSPLLREHRSKLHVLANGIDLDPYVRPTIERQAQASTIRKQYADRGPIWVGCGRLIYYKGFQTAIQALKDCPGTLILVGDGPERPGLELQAQRLGVADRVVFAGSMPYQDVVPYYLAATAFWFPSCARTEAFGIAQVEAMASGCPVINTAIPHSGVAWVSRHDQTGLTVPVGDPRAFADAVRKLAANRGLRAQYGDAARERALELFDHRAMARRSLEIYRTALAGATDARAEKELAASYV